MNPNEESLISAYLDGELDPPRRMKVEAALLADPKLAERLQELSCVRGFVSGLPRPTVHHDVSGQVLARIEQLPQVRLRRFVRESLQSPRRVGLFAGVAAALVMAVAIPLVRHNSEQEKDFRNPSSPSVVTVPQRETKPSPRPESLPELKPSPATVVAADRNETKPIVTPPRSLAPSDVERRAGKDQETLAGVLDRPGVRRLLLYVDSLDSRTLNHVESALQKTHRTHSFRARQRVAQSIVIDPSLPNEAVVYTVVLTDHERSALERNLDAVVEVEPEGEDQPQPELLTRLTEVEDLKIFDFPSHAEPVKLNALRSTPVQSPASPLGHVVDLDPGVTAGSPLRVNPRTVFKDRTPKTPAAPSVPKVPEDEEGTVYLVWVTTRPRA